MTAQNNIHWVLSEEGSTTSQVIQVVGNTLILHRITDFLEGLIESVCLANCEDITDLVEDFDIKIGDRVCHVKDQDLCGEVVYIDFNLIAAGWDNTTCLVRWDGGDIGDIQWTNKLDLLDGNDR